MASKATESKLLESKDTIKKLHKIIDQQNKLIDSLQKTLEENNASIASLKEQIDFLTRKLFGHSSEKNIPGQLSLFDEESPAPEEPPEEQVVIPEHVRKKRRTNQELFKGLPQKEEVIYLDEDERTCKTCGTELVLIGKEFVRQEFRYKPAKGYVVNIYRGTYKCPKCSTAPTMAKAVQFVKAHVPEALIPDSYASSSSVAWTIYQRYSNSMPLYRQESDWAQLGVELSRATLANWINTCALQYYKPVWDYFHREMLKRSFMMADETPWQVLKEPERSPESKSYIWLFRTGEDGKPVIILYNYTETRAKYNAEDFLRGFEGYLMCDAYQGYNKLPNVIRCCCFAHLRRDFRDAIPKGHEKDLTEPAVQAVQYLDKLFHYEQLSREKGHTFEQRKAYRLKKEKPVLDAFWDWLDKQTPRKNSRFDKAVTYAKNRKAYAENYLEDGRCSLSNNLSENSIRPVTVGRKNSLFSDTPKGAEATAICYSMVAMAKAHKLNVYKYLKYLLDKRPDKTTSDADFEKLVPWNEEVQRICSNVNEE